MYYSAAERAAQDLHNPVQSGSKPDLLISLSSLLLYSTLDSVKVFDLLARNEVTSSRFNQGGTAVLWAPASVSLTMYDFTTGMDCDC